ncbi:MAG: hypothetical protein ACLP1Y_02170 [Candidatus Acidiferrales bacterium]
MFVWWGIFPLLSSCGSVGGGGGAAPAPNPPTVQVLPQNPNVKTGAQQVFSATITNGSGSVTWAASPNDGAHGSIDGNGVYTAPLMVPTSNSVTISATLQSSPSAVGTSVATIVPGTTTVTVSPPLSSLTPSQSLQLTAGGVNTTNSSVTWSVDSVPGGNKTVGTISAQGVYSPSASSAGQHTVTATSTNGSGASGTASVWVTTYAGTFSWRNDTSISGVNSQELALSPATVSSANFGKLFSCSVDGAIYAQPLYVANLSITSQTTQQQVTANVVFVATENDSLYAFDADASPCVKYWHDSLLPAGEEPVPSTSGSPVGSTDITPVIGITGTPVIDSKTNTLYVVSKSEQFTVNPLAYVQRLHAIDITTGLERPSSPTPIVACALGTGDGSTSGSKCGTNSGSVINFNALRENQRAGLLLLNGVVYIAFASHGDVDPYHGWVLAYNETTLQQVAVFNDTPNGIPSEGGIWLGAAAPSVDPDTGYIYVASGNGAFDTTLNASGFPTDSDFGESLLKLGPTTLSVVDYFTPCDPVTLSGNDQDMGPFGVVILPDNANAAHPYLLLTGDKAGDVFLLDRTKLGQYTGGLAQTCPDTTPVEGVNFTPTLYGTPAAWKDSQGVVRLYLVPGDGPIGIYPIAANCPVPPTGPCPMPTAPASVSSAVFSGRAPSPAISANNGTNGVLWLIDASQYKTSGPAILRAYDATNLATELYDSTQASNSRDTAGTIVKFSVPTVANGKVYVGTQTELDVYGLLP